MQKAIVIAVLACSLFVFSIIYHISQTAEAGCDSKVAVSQRLVAKDNNIVGGSIVQVSVIQTGDVNAEGKPGGNSGDEPNESSGGDNSGGSNSNNDTNSGNGSGDGNNLGPGGGSNYDSYGSFDEGFDKYKAMVADQISKVRAGTVVINEVHPGQETALELGDEAVELYNMGSSPVNVSLWNMKNMAGQVIGTINVGQILPYEFLVVEVNGLAGDSQRVALFDSKDNKIDSVIYMGAGSHKGSCYGRIPDGTNAWEWTACTLGGSNQQGYTG